MRQGMIHLSGTFLGSIWLGNQVFMADPFVILDVAIHLYPQSVPLISQRSDHLELRRASGNVGHTLLRAK